ncbi:MAG: helix-turn-helix transcriptional regulator [Chitinophagaceae bacterium]|nr:helix-turn-helix transcriptional regulator [Chitinophagaceae bacterium]
MEVQESFKQIASLIGEPARSTMLWCLLEGRAMTATELAFAADVSAQSASMHLSKLMQASLLKQEKQGRHKYYKLAKPEVAYVIESIASLLPEKKENRKVPDHNSGVRFCRTCYDHLAGKVGVSITEQLLRKGYLLYSETDYSIPAKGSKWFHALGIDIEALRSQRRAFARPCLDWSERRHHLAGSLGSALLNMMLEKDWMRRKKQSREIILTSEGTRKLYELLKLDIPNL